MNSNTQIACVLSGPFFAIVLILGWCVFAGFIPPHPPSATAGEIADYYHSGINQTRFGLMLMMSASGFFAPWVAVIYVYMKRIEGDKFPVLSMTQVVSGVYGIIVIVFPSLIWTAAAFRPDRDPQLILLLNDLGWLNFLMVWSPAFVQNVCIGTAILQDKSPTPVISRWVGFFNIWVAILYVPAGLMTFFKSGPFAWNGIVSFWIPAIAFLIWFIVMTFSLLKAIRAESEEQRNLSARLQVGAR